MDGERLQRDRDVPSANPFSGRSAQGTRQGGIPGKWFWVLLPKQKYLAQRGRNPRIRLNRCGSDNNNPPFPTIAILSNKRDCIQLSKERCHPAIADGEQH